MEKPIDIIESGEYVEPNYFESEGESKLFHSLLEWMDYSSQLQKENEELREAVKQVLSISDLWLINPENCPPEHRGEMEVLENMHGKLLKLTNNEN